MKFIKQRRLRAARKAAQALQVRASVRELRVQSLPAVVATAFGRLRISQRVRVLRRLLLPVGPMALLVLGGGVFAKYVGQARWSRISVSIEDAAMISASQVYELVRYVEQSNPVVLQDVLLDLARDSNTMATLGASVAAIVMTQIAKRNTTLLSPLRREPE